MVTLFTKIAIIFGNRKCICGLGNTIACAGVYVNAIIDSYFSNKIKSAIKFWNNVCWLLAFARKYRKKVSVITGFNISVQLMWKKLTLLATRNSRFESPWYLFERPFVLQSVCQPFSVYLSSSLWRNHRCTVLYCNGKCSKNAPIGGHFIDFRLRKFSYIYFFEINLIYCFRIKIF